MHVTSADHQALYRSEEVREAFYAHSVERMRPILAMLLCLCTTEPDIVSNRKPGLKPANNEGRHVKKGFRLFPAEGPHIWNVGSPWGNDMAKHYRVVHDESKASRATRSAKSARTSAPRIGMGTGRGVGPRPRKRICANSSSIGFRPCSCAAQEMSNPSSVPPKLKVTFDAVSRRRNAKSAVNKFLKQIRDNDPTRENGFMANILETPKAKEERLEGAPLLGAEALPRRMPEGRKGRNGRLRKRQMQCELNPKLEEMRSVAGAVKRPRPRRRVQGSFI